jgi:hypothetical protein
MVPRGNDVATMGVPDKLLREEFVSRMAQQGNDAASRDVPMEPTREEFASHMVQR